MDIFQDALVCLCRLIKEEKFKEKYEVAGFLYSVSRNLWINKVKKDSRMQHWPDDMEVMENYDFSNDIMTEENARTIRETIKLLGEKCFKLLQYAMHYNKSNNEICELMGFATVNAVKTQKYKCKQKLSSIIESSPAIKEVID